MHFAARSLARRSSPARALHRPSRRRGRACAWLFQLALGLAAGLCAATSFGADPPGTKAVQRQIEDTRAIDAEVSSAVRRVQAENLGLRRTLVSEVRTLTVDEVTAAALRLARLDADTARLHVTTLAARIAQREASTSLLDQDIDRRASSLQVAPATTLKTLGAKAGLDQLRELRAANVDLIDGMRDLRSAESEHLALADERLALLRSRARLAAIRANDGLDQDPKAVAIEAVISRLGREAIQLYNEVGSTRPKASTDPARKAFLQLEAGDAIIRGSVRVGDLDLIRIGNQLTFFDELVQDDSIPIAILEEARAELDADQGRLRDRLAALQADRLTLDGQRELVGAQAGALEGAGGSPLGTVEDLAQLLDFQQADVTRLEQRLDQAATQVDSRIVQRRIAALYERRPLPSNPGHWQLVRHELFRLPEMVADYWQSIVSDLIARLGALPARALAGLGALVVLVCGALWWLARVGLPWIAKLNPAGKLSVPLAALRRSLPMFGPVAIWVVVARTLAVPEPLAWLLTGTLGLLPLAGFLLNLSALLFARASGQGAVRRRLHALTRWAVLAITITAALGFLVTSVPVLPSVADLVDRVGFAGLLLAAFATWLLRDDLLSSMRATVAASRAGRLLAAASHVVPGLMLVAAVAGLGGWINLGWAIAHGVAAFLTVGGAALLLCSILGELAGALERRYGGTAGTGAPGASQTIRAGYRLAVVAVVVGAAWLLASLYLRSGTGTAVFWTLVVAGALPFILQPVQILVASLLRIDPERRPDGSISIPAICLDRGIRTLLIIGAVLGLAWALDFDLVAVATGDSLLTRIVRAAFNVAVVLLVADFVWHLASTAIDSRLQTADDEGPIESDEARRRARLRTLLPIMRNVLLILVAITAALMALSSIGVQIGPLLAGAGVVGIAVGFGAQTLVKDIFSGVFFLLDDAFRIGEYIQSGSFKGTVEAFSLRSIKLRHHRGALFTVPFGELGAVQNLSRDWVIDKIGVQVTYDTDLAKVKQAIKEVSKEIMAEPELAAHVLQPLKMQGVEQFGDFAIEIRMKMMTKPGEQFVIRRRAYALIKKVFNANGIEFAFPTVQVAGGAAGTGAVPAAAQEALKRLQPAPASSS